MCRYVYGFRCESEDGEVFFRFPRFPEIVTAVKKDSFDAMTDEDVHAYAHDAVITALQAIIAAREDIPGADRATTRADGFVRLSVQESMKLSLYEIYKENCRSIAEFAQELGKSETAARRLLDLSHGSRPNEIEAAVQVFGKRLDHDWEVVPGPLTRRTGDPRRQAVRSR